MTNPTLGYQRQCEWRCRDLGGDGVSVLWRTCGENVSSGDVGEGRLSSHLYQHWVVASRRMLRRNVRYSKPLQHCLHRRQESASHLTLTRSPILTDEVAAIHPCEYAVRVGLADAVLLDDMLGVSSSACSTGWSSIRRGCSTPFQACFRCAPCIAVELGNVTPPEKGMGMTIFAGAG